MAQLLPLDATEEAYTLPVELEGVELTLRAYWLERAAGWYLDAFDAAGETLALGVRIAPGSILAFPGAAVGLPPGRFVAVGPDAYAYEDLGPQVQVAYLTRAEVAGLREGFGADVG